MKKEDANYLWGNSKYLYVDNIIHDFCEDKYDFAHSHVMYPALTFYLGTTMSHNVPNPCDQVKDICPNVIIYSRRYYEPTRRGFKKDFKVKETVEIMAFVGSNTWLRLGTTKSFKNTITGLDNVFDYIVNDIAFDYNHDNLGNVSNISLYAIRVPDIDLVTIDLIPKLIENKIEII
jgi:hypothetical protein